MSDDPAVVRALYAHVEAWVHAAWDQGWRPAKNQRQMLGVAITVEAALGQPTSALAQGSLARRVVRTAHALASAGYGPGTEHEIVLELVCHYDDEGDAAGLLRVIESAELLRHHRP